jgi:hypothetical protein
MSDSPPSLTTLLQELRSAIVAPTEIMVTIGKTSWPERRWDLAAREPARKFFAWLHEQKDLEAFPHAARVALRKLNFDMGGGLVNLGFADPDELVEQIDKVLAAPPCPRPWAKCLDLTANHHRLLDCLWGDNRPREPILTSEVLKAVYGRSPHSAAKRKDQLRALRALARRAQRILDGDTVPLIIYIDNPYSELK